ncbi:hypothetical protein TorRG33x02_031340 [Trema orientale]|uniref:Uncharacterized protein n=1 Tax=Trema orientale TaxID=63057 RepID=A0A2P5FT43_TREOI|nr:hypothetical protein TorRG33x02_031340 [Trema orientale]
MPKPRLAFLGSPQRPSLPLSDAPYTLPPPPKSTTTPLHIFFPSASAQILLCSLLHLTRPW